jgi:hypothetical protein
MLQDGTARCSQSYWSSALHIVPKKDNGWRPFGDHRALRGLASLCPGATILLYIWPHETLCDQLHCCFGAWVGQILDGLEHLES